MGSHKIELGLPGAIVGGGGPHAGLHAPVLASAQRMLAGGPGGEPRPPAPQCFACRGSRLCLVTPHLVAARDLQARAAPKLRPVADLRGAGTVPGGHGAHKVHQRPPSGSSQCAMRGWRAPPQGSAQASAPSRPPREHKPPPPVRRLIVPPSPPQTPAVCRPLRYGQGRPTRGEELEMPTRSVSLKGP